MTKQQQSNEQHSSLLPQKNDTLRSSTQTDSRSRSPRFGSMMVQRGAESLQRLRAGIFLSDVFIGMALSGISFSVEYFCDMWFESVDLSKHYKTAIRVSLQLVAVVIALVVRELLQKLFEVFRGPNVKKIHVKFTTELFGLILGFGLVIMILFLTAKKN